MSPENVSRLIHIYIYIYIYSGREEDKTKSHHPTKPQSRLLGLVKC